MGAKRSLETSVQYQTTLRNIPKDDKTLLILPSLYHVLQVLPMSLFKQTDNIGILFYLTNTVYLSLSN